MPSPTNVVTATEPESAVPSLQVFSTRFFRRSLADRAARYLVTLGGMAIIASILAILLVIVGEVVPLFRPAAARPIASVPVALDGPALAVEVDEYRAVAAVVTESGLLFSALFGEPVVSPPNLPALGAAKVTSVSQSGRKPLALGLSDGRVLPIEIGFRTSFENDRRRVEAEPRPLEPLTIDPQGRPIRIVAHAVTEVGSTTAAAVGPKQVVLVRVSEESSLLGDKTRHEARSALDLATEGELSALAVDGRGDNVFVGTAAGEVLRIDSHAAEPQPTAPRQLASKPGAKITLLGFVLGDRTLVVGDGAGGLSSWQLLPGAEGEPELTKIQDFPGHRGAVSVFSPSRRHKGFWTGDTQGELRFHYAVTGQTLLAVGMSGEVPAAIAFSPKSDGLVAIGSSGRLLGWDIDCPHPEVSLRSLFGKVWYEGYARPEYVWQSTGGSDDFEPKFSLTPLIFGTLKGTFYALMFAVPIALLAALYASQFMHPRLKGVVKPTVEVMAALPSVVLGFMAGLWLAPTVERIVPGLFLAPLVTAGVVLLALVMWRLLPREWRSRLNPGTEVFVLLPVVLFGLWLSFHLGWLVERELLAGDYRSWLAAVFGVTFDQRNSIVVGLAMGFAVIPVIFTIAEDSLSNVPPHLTAGSLALGATRWQTAVRVVLPSASPGIFSAVMIGFGRAVGETMIVLMATGNTPIMGWSIFNGFRALSANIAVELPEAPEGGTLFRVLFVAALLLFVITFLVNTLAELVRLRLRQKYRTL